MTLPFKLDSTKVGLSVLFILLSWFGIQQCRAKEEAKGDTEAARAMVTYWADKDQVDHTKVGLLMLDNEAAKRQVDSLRTIKGAKVIAATEITQHGQEVLRPIQSSSYNIFNGTKPSNGIIRSSDTAEYVLTARDSLDWLLHATRTYTSPWDTIRVIPDSAILKVNDKLHVVESQVKEGGLFNRRIVPYVDVYHDNPMLKTTNIRAWRVAVPVKHWGIGPSVNMYPRLDNGIKFGYSFGISLTYTAIAF